MRRLIPFTLLSLGFLGAVGPRPAAALTPSSSIAVVTAQADFSASLADSTAAMPPAAAPAAPAAAAPAPTPVPPPAAKTEAAPKKRTPNDRIYYGGTVTISFGSPSRLGLYPLIGYKLTPKISAGVEVGYEYVNYSGGPSTNNYGGSVFGRYRVGRNLYAHAEYQTTNYEIPHVGRSSTREWVPFVLVGGGVVKPIGPRTAVYAEVLFDVLQDQNSPYGDWEPWVSFGVSAGF